MARPSKFSDEEVMNAAAAIEAEGKEVTGYTLSVALKGGRPSSLEEKYKELTASREKIVSLPSLPTEIEIALEDLVGEIGQRLHHAMTRAHATVKALANDRIDEIEKKADAGMAKLRADLDAASDDKDAQRDRANAAEDALKKAQEQIIALQGEIAKRDGQLVSMGNANADLQDKLTELRAAIQKLENEKTSLTNKLDEARTTVAESKAEARDAKKEASDASARAAAAEATAKQIQIVSDKAANDLTAANKALGQLEGQLKATVADLDAKTKELDAIKAQPPVPAQAEAATKNH